MHGHLLNADRDTVPLFSWQKTHKICLFLELKEVACEILSADVIDLAIIETFCGMIPLGQSGCPLG